jgi:hypothetical protein
VSEIKSDIDHNGRKRGEPGFYEVGQYGGRATLTEEDDDDEQDQPPKQGTPEKPHALKKFTPKFQIASRGFVAFPAFFIDEMMALGRYIPADFWQFLMIVWRDVNHHADSTCDRSMRQFHIRPTKASKWTAALMVSGLFYVRYGWKHKNKEKGVPTQFTYLDGDFQTWEIFIEALNEQIKADKDHGYDDCGGGFRAELLLRILRMRIAKTGETFTDVEKKFLTQLGNAGFVDIAKIDKGVIEGVAKRLKSDRGGVLSSYEKINGAYPSKGEPDFDDEGKQIRMHRQLERSVAKITIDFRKAKH